MEVASVSSPSCAGDNGRGSNVQCSPEFRFLLNQVEHENLKVQVLKARIQAARTIKKISFIKHRFVTLELYSARVLHIFYVTAELNRIGANGVINVRIDDCVCKKVVETEIELELYERNAYIRLSEVIAVLVDHCSDYNIFRDNCYQYADNMFRTVVKTFGIDVVQSEEKKAMLQRGLDNHPRPVLLNDVFKKRYVGDAVVGTGLAVAAVVLAAVVNLPIITLFGLHRAPKALSLTAGAISLSNAILIGGIATRKWWQCVTGSVVFWSRERKATLQRVLHNHPRPGLLNDVFNKRYVAGAVVGTGVAAAVVAIAAVVYWPFTLVVLWGPMTLRSWILLCLLDGLDVLQIPARNSYIAHSLNEKIGSFKMEVASVISDWESYIDLNDHDLWSRLKQFDPDMKPENLTVQVLKANIRWVKAFRDLSEPTSFRKHRFVTLELYSALLRHIFHVRAELLLIGGNHAIEVRIVDCEALETEFEVKLCEENEFPVSEVIDVLVGHSSDYNILRDNYYQYADSMFRNVVKRFGIEVVQSEEMKATLQRALDNHIVYIWTGIYPYG